MFVGETKLAANRCSNPALLLLAIALLAAEWTLRRRAGHA
jgi:hypothetical protein